MINFKINSIFSRSHGGEKEIEPERDVQVLAVWGSAGSGKTTVAVKLAKYLADKKKNVALLLCDMTAPMLPCIVPPGELEEEHSLGSILAATHVTDNLVRQNCVMLKKQSYLTVIGMLKGENVFTYPPYSQTQASELIEHLRNIAPYIIIDCGSAIATDVLSAVSLMEADSVLRLVNCDLKSISYLSSQLPLLAEQKWDADKQYKVASNVWHFEADENIKQVLGGVTFTVPHSPEVAGQFLSGDLCKDLGLKDSRSFRKEIEKISKEVFGI